MILLAALGALSRQTRTAADDAVLELVGSYIKGANFYMCVHWCLYTDRALYAQTYLTPINQSTPTQQAPPAAPASPSSTWACTSRQTSPWACRSRTRFWRCICPRSVRRGDLEAYSMGSMNQHIPSLNP